MTNNKLTDGRLSQIGRKHFYPHHREPYVPFGDEVVSMVRELQEYRKAQELSQKWEGSSDDYGAYVSDLIQGIDALLWMRGLEHGFSMQLDARCMNGDCSGDGGPVMVWTAMGNFIKVTGGERFIKFEWMGRENRDPSIPEVQLAEALNEMYPDRDQ